jgi:hypothetical protein
MRCVNSSVVAVGTSSEPSLPGQGSPAVCHGQNVQSVFALDLRQALGALADRNEAVTSRVIQEGIDLVGVQCFGEQIARWVQRKRQIRGRNCEQAFERSDPALGIVGDLLMTLAQATSDCPLHVFTIARASSALPGSTGHYR